MAQILIPDGLLELAREIGAPILLADLDGDEPGLYTAAEAVAPQDPLIVTRPDAMRE